MGWNNGYSFPLEKIFRLNHSIRWSYIDLLRLFPSQHKGFNFLEEDWNYAFVLDACRYDLFEETNFLDGTLELKKSIASATREWVSKAIKREYKDIILISANPFLSKLKLKELCPVKKPFYKNVAAWDIGWDDKLHTTPPWAMVEIFKKNLKKYPDKRFVLWFNQPHHPFIDYKGLKETHDCRKIVLHNRDKKEFKNIWQLIESGRADLNEVWNGYKRNLEIALKSIENILGLLNGRIVITSDHGNCFGEMGIFEHPRGVHIPPLVNVPYLTIDI